MIHEPLDLQYWFVNVFSGNWTIFIFVFSILIAGLAAKFRMNNASFGFTMFLFAILLSPQFNWIIVLAVIFASFFTFYSMSKFVNR